MKSYGEFPVMTAKAATGIGTPIYVGDATEIKVQLDIAGTATGTVKFQGSDQQDMPTFSSAQSASNKWDYVEVIDNEDGSAIDGDTGVSAAGAADHRNFTINVDAMRWFCANITSYSAGTFTITVVPYDEG